MLTIRVYAVWHKSKIVLSLLLLILTVGIQEAMNIYSKIDVILRLVLQLLSTSLQSVLVVERVLQVGLISTLSSESAYAQNMV